MNGGLCPRVMETSCGVVLVNFGSILLLQYPQGHWDFPKGHVEEGDADRRATAARELKEETSIVSVELIKEIDKKLTYILPKHLIGIIWKGRFKGQIQKWFVMRFNGKESEININTKKPEFLDWKWINIEDLPKIAVNFKLNVYKSLREELSKILN